jgi:transposase-like protein
MLRCPRCSSTDIVRHRSPREIEGTIYRRHRCTPCGKTFLSAQMVIDLPAAERLLLRLEL